MTSAPLPSVSRRTSSTKSVDDVVDAVVEPEVDQPVESLVARRGGQHRGPGPLGQLDGGDPDAAGTGVDERGLAGLEAPEFEQAVVGGAEGDRHAGRLLGGRRRRGSAQQNDSPTARSSAWDPSRPTVTTRSPGGEAG